MDAVQLHLITFAFGLGIGMICGILQVKIDSAAVRRRHLQTRVLSHLPLERIGKQ
jgi:hypothetical protein